MTQSWTEVDKINNAVKVAYRAGSTQSHIWECPCCMFNALRNNTHSIEQHIRDNKCGVLTDSM